MFRVLFCALALTAGAFAQTASITGRVTDPNGAVVPGVHVTALSRDSGFASEANTNQDGYYSLSSLQPGAYNLSLSKSGFMEVREENLVLEVQQVARMDFKLKLGTINEKIDVTAEAPLVESESSTMGQVIPASQVSELPLLGRNPYALAMLVPGVRPDQGANNLPIDQISSVSYSINGQRSSANEFLLDGAPNSSAAQGQPVVNATPDMVQEFKVETNNYSAEYGRASGGVFNVVTKSGSNKFHGTLYEFFRNDKLNANNFFANATNTERPPFKYNQFGGTIGGPVVIPHVYDGHNKTFFFYNFEDVRFIQGVVFVGTLPTTRELSGDFTQDLNSAGKLITIFDPLTTTTVGSTSTRTAFADNIIPSSRINPVTAQILKYFPAPTQAGQGFTHVNDYSYASGNIVHKNTMSYKVDHYFSERNRIFARYSVDDTPDTRAGAYGSNPASPSAGVQRFGRRNTVVEDNETFTPTLLGTFRLTVTRLSNFRVPFANGFDITSLGFPAGLAKSLWPPSFPDITIAGYSINSSITNIITGGLLGATDQIAQGANTWGLQGAITKTAGGHEFKMGSEFRIYQLNNQQTGANSPNFAFAANWTQGPNATAASTTAGDAAATFLLGIPTGAANPVPGLTMQTKYTAVYFQDNYKVTPRLTLNYGVRYEYETPRTDRYNQLTNFDYAATPPLNTPGLTLHGALTFVGVNGVSRYQGDPEMHNFSPRLGLAFRVNDKTVIRTGGGLFYASIWGVGTGSASFGSSGFINATNIVQPNAVLPQTFLNNPFPTGLVPPTGSSLGPATLLGQAITFYDRGNRTPYSGSWNFNIQRQLPANVLLEVGYLGSRGVKFPISALTLDQLPTADLALGNALNTQVPNPFFGQIATGVDATATVAQAQLLRPYPHYNGVTSDDADLANSSYNALTVRAERRYSKGLTLLFSYTYSKTIDLQGAGFSGETDSAVTIQNWNNLKGEYAPSVIDQTHRFVFSAVYQLPFFKGRHGFLEAALGGWEVGAIFSHFTGGPLGMQQNTNNTGSQGGGQRPNWSGINATLANPSPYNWFDATQFSTAPAFAFGNVARTLGGLRSAGLHSADLSLNKFFTIHEQLKLQFRSEFFNITNSVQFGPPNTNLGAAPFDTVSIQNNQPRIVQLALKLLF
jgi:outer membrane receptor protein involved in Fe transport